MVYTMGVATTIEVVSLQRVKENLRITHNFQDALLQNHIDTAVTVIENYTSRAVHMRQVVATGRCFIDGLVLEQGPVNGDVVIEYRDEANTLVILDTGLYTIGQSVSGETIVVYSCFADLPEVFDRSDAIKLTYSIGYTAAQVPPPFKTFALLITAKLYELPADTALQYDSFAKSFLFRYKKQVTSAA